MTCPEMKTLWEKFEKGMATEEELGKLELHMQDCKECSDFMNRQLHEDEPESNESRKEEPFQNMNFSRSLKKAKWRQRFSQTMFIVVIIIFILVIGSVSSNLYYSGKKLEQIQSVETLAVESLLPNVHVQGMSLNIKPFFRMESNMDMVKGIGYETKPVGHMKLFHVFNPIRNVEKIWTGGGYDLKMNFVHPSFKANEDLNHWNSEAWNALEKLPDGTVTELALSFDKPYTIEELDGILSKVIIDDRKMPVWYALDTGESSKEDPYLLPGQVIGFPRNFSLDEESEGVDYTQEQRVEKMVKLLSENEATIENMQITFRNLTLKERYNYLKKNGVKVYGVVLTGPTKDFLELKKLNQIKFVSIGDVELWNWYERPTSGTMN